MTPLQERRQRLIEEAKQRWPGYVDGRFNQKTRTFVVIYKDVKAYGLACVDHDTTVRYSAKNDALVMFPRPHLWCPGCGAKDAASDVQLSAAKQRAAERVAEAISLLEQGMTYEEAGRALGVSRQRVQQIVAPYWKMPAKMRSEHVGRRFAEKAQAIRERILDGATPDEIAEEFGIQRSAAKDHFKRNGFPQRISIPRRGIPRKYTDEDLLNMLRTAYGKHSQPVRANMLKGGTMGGPAQAIRNRWGTWNNACRAAGVPAGGYEKPRVDRADDEYLQQHIDTFASTAPKITLPLWLEWAAEQGVRGRATLRARDMVAKAQRERYEAEVAENRQRMRNA